MSRASVHIEAYGGLRTQVYTMYILSQAMAPSLASARPRPSLTGTELRRRRRALNLTQATLGRELAVTATTVARWERGEQVIGHPGAVLLALDHLAELLSRERDSAPRTALARGLNGTGVVPHNLPLQVSSCVGRERQVQEIKDLLARERLVTITGTGGVGKTRLAVEVASQVLADYPDGVWFVDLSTVSEQSDVVRALAGVLRIAQQRGRSMLDTLCTVLSSESALLVLDNCEHVLGPSARVVHALVSRSPSVRVLTTSRERLDLAGELVYQLAALRLPTEARVTSALEVQHAESVQLFVRRAAESLATFTLTDENAFDIVQLCHRLEGIPLALELAAARVHALGLKQLADRLDDSFGVLLSNGETKPDRHHTVNAAIDWSYRLLSPVEQCVFNRLSVFVGGWTVEAAEAVVADAVPEPGLLLEVLCQLVTKSLVLADMMAGGSVRYRQLEMLRQFGAERLQESGDADGVRGRHAKYCLELAERTQPELRMYEVKTELSYLEFDRDNLRAALDWCVDRQQAENALRLGNALWPFWYVGGYAEEGWTRLKRLTAMPAVESHLRARILFALATLAYRRGEHRASEALAEECLGLSRTFADRVLVSAVLTHLGNIARLSHRFSRSRTLLDAAMKEARLADCPAMEIDCLLHLAQLDWLGGDQRSAHVRLSQALSSATDIGDSVGVVGALRGLGELAYRTADLALARVLLEESAAHASRLGDRWRIAWAPVPLGYVLVDLGEHDRASAIWGRSLHLWRDLGNMSHLASVLEGFGYQAAQRGRVRRALVLHFAANVVRRSQGASIFPEAEFWLARWLASARARVSQAELAMLRARGEALTLDEAIEYALCHPDREASGIIDQPEPEDALSPRETEVAKLIVLGLSNREIAETLVISEHTVHSHVRRILRKLDLRRRVQIATWRLTSHPSRAAEHDTGRGLRSINHPN
jgi:predicted ATPase/DNA-binding CsgD family transcriptional regulator